MTNRTGLLDTAFRRNYNEPRRGLSRSPAGLVVEPSSRDQIVLGGNSPVKLTTAPVSRFAKYSSKFILKAEQTGLLNWLPDKTYLKLIYKCKMKRKLNLRDPKTYNEKLQWLKLYDRRPEYTTMVDKRAVKKYVANKIGEQYVIPTLGVWSHFEDIDFKSLPNQFVLKCTHDSGGLVICTDKSKFDYLAAAKKIKKCLRTNYYIHGREYPYKNITPRIIAEKYMVDESGYELKDYKFFCFNGVAKIMFIASDRQLQGEETKFDFYDMDFKHLPFTNGHPNSSHELIRPKTFSEMQRLAESLSQGIPHARIDFYNINGQIYFGEITLFHWSGMIPFEPDVWDKKLGDYIELPNISK